MDEIGITPKPSVPLRTTARTNFAATPKAAYVGARGQLAASNGTLYTASTVNLPAAGAVATVKQIILCNTDTVARTVTLYGVESGGSAAANRALLSAVTIAASTVYQFLPDFPLQSGDTIQGLSDAASKVTYHIIIEV